MAMLRTTFVKRLSSGQANHYTYSAGGLTGLVSVWRHDGSFIMTREECPLGQQYDESTYTREERHVFATIDEKLEFLAAIEIKPEWFEP